MRATDCGCPLGASRIHPPPLGGGPLREILWSQARAFAESLRPPHPLAIPKVKGSQGVRRFVRLLLPAQDERQVRVVTLTERDRWQLTHGDLHGVGRLRAAAIRRRKGQCMSANR